MAYNGSGTFLINTAGQPVVAGTVISSTTFNSLTADLATGLSTVITKDGQTTVTANIPMASFKFTGLGVGSAAGDSANLSQVQSTVTKLLTSVSGTDTITAVGAPVVAAYAAGQMFYFVATGDNTTSVTINIDGLGAKAVTRDGSVALVAGDIKSGEVVVVVYDGTRFQVVSQLNSAGNATFANVSITSALNVGGVATFSAGTAAAPSITTTGDTNTGIFFPAADTIAFTEGGVESARIDSFGNLGLGVVPSAGAASTNASPQLQLGSAMTLFGFSTSTNRQANIACNAYYDNANNFKYINTDAATVYRQLTGAHAWYNAASGSANATITFTQAMALDASGTLNIKTGAITGDDNATLTASAIGTNGTVAKINSAGTGGIIRFDTNGSERIRLDSSGKLLVGATTAPSGGLPNILSANSAGGGVQFHHTSSGGGGLVGGVASGGLLFYTYTGSIGSESYTERARITAAGDLLIGKTGINLATVGVELRGGNTDSYFTVTDATSVLALNRETADGDLIRFFQGSGGFEGSISVSGNTVSYNAFAGSHWSQLQDGSKPDILRGTVMESINELCVWPDETNERLPKSKVSDTAGSKKVYGVFMAWEPNWDTTNDMLITSVGAFICRVNASVTVQEGDLLESNGDGTARVQADDIIRSSTIGKVTSTVKTHQYADGSYCVPTVLYCG